MCGIAGIYDLTGSGAADPSTCFEMASFIRHRGPDSTGAFHWPETKPNIAFAARRLSVIDLKTGHQPISNEAGSHMVVCNGEIYNFVELRDELVGYGHQFRTASDVEVLVHLYEQFGLTMFNRIRGMYAFALWDGLLERLLLAVDPVGIKPLYLLQVDGLLQFASEIKAFSADPSAELGMNLAAFDTFLSFGYMIGSETLFSRVQRFPAGHALVIQGSRMQWLRYECPKYEPNLPIHPAEGAKHIRSILTETLAMQLRSDVPVGLFLSGGLDSASILAVSSSLRNDPIPTYTVGHKIAGGSPDPVIEDAASLARAFGSEHTVVELSAEDWWAALLRYISVHDEPNANPAAVSMLQLATEAAREIKVVLTGLGGDEVFRGYPHHYHLPRDLQLSRRIRSSLPAGISDLLGRSALSCLHRGYPHVRRIRGISGAWAWLQARAIAVLPREQMLLAAFSYEGFTGSTLLRHLLYTDTLRTAERLEHKQHSFEAILRQSKAESDEDIIEELVMDVWLPGNGLLSLDHVTMANSLEARVPYFDPFLMQAAQQQSARLPRGSGKWLLRQAMADILPSTILSRKKQAFEVPLRAWFDHELSDRVITLLLEPRTLSRGFFRPEPLKRLVHSHYSGRVDHTEFLFRLIVFELWSRVWIDGHGRNQVA